MTEAEKNRFNFLFQKVKSLYEEGKFKKGYKTFVLISLYNGWLNIDDLYLYKQVNDNLKKAGEQTQTQKPKFEFDIPYYDISYIKDVDRIIEYRGDKTLIHTEKGAMDLNSNSPDITEDLINGSIDVRRKNRIKKFGKFIGNIINNIEKFLFKKYRKSYE